jgi:hypothetical protein
VHCRAPALEALGGLEHEAAQRLWLHGPARGLPRALSHPRGRRPARE